MTAQRVEIIKDTLSSAFDTSEVTVVDEGHKHVGHAGAKTGLGHFAVTLRSAQFEGLPLLERHKQVYASLGSLMQTDIHALSIRPLAPGE